MPIFVQPSLRQRQRAMELNGILQARNSVDVTQQQAKEAAGVKKVYTPGATIILRGTKYTEPVSGA